MKLPGLHHQISLKRAAAGAAAREARATTDARTSYEQGVSAEKLALESEALSEHLHGNEQVMEGLLHQIHYLSVSPHKSRHRSLAITELENAYARLLMENGETLPTPPTDS